MYYNNVLQSGNVDFVIMEVEAKGRLVNQATVSEWGSDLTVHVSLELGVRTRF